MKSLGEGLILTDITGGEIYLVKCLSDYFDQPVSQSPSFSALWHVNARNVALPSNPTAANWSFLGTYSPGVEEGATADEIKQAHKKGVPFQSPPLVAVSFVGDPIFHLLFSLFL